MLAVPIAIKKSSERVPTNKVGNLIQLSCARSKASPRSARGQGERVFSKSRLYNGN